MASAIYNAWKPEEVAMIRRVVTNGDTETEYVGLAPRGSLEQDAVWRCFRVARKTVGGVVIERITHTQGMVAVGADGAAMAALTYA